MKAGGGHSMSWGPSPGFAGCPRPLCTWQARDQVGAQGIGCPVGQQMSALTQDQVTLSVSGSRVRCKVLEGTGS